MSAVASFSFEELVADVSAGNNKVPKANYLAAGKYPIVDQGQELVGGYSNSDENLVDGDGPWIVFGDHTRAIKYIDMPFCMGADGVKVLRPRSAGTLDPKYLYHFLSANPVPSAGYSRHFKFLKSLSIPLPPIDEQRRIAAILDKADTLRWKRKRALELLDGLTQAIFIEIFGDPIENTRGHPTEKLSNLVDEARGISYGIVQRGADLDDGVSVIRISDFQSGKLDASNLKKTSADISNKYKRTILHGGELVISIRGTVGRCAEIPNSLSGANVSREVAVIPTLSREKNNFYLALLRSRSAQRRIAGDIKGVAQSGINLEDLRALEIIQPNTEAMKRFDAAMYLSTEIEAHQTAASLLAESQFQAIQHRVFSGEL